MLLMFPDALSPAQDHVSNLGSLEPRDLGTAFLVISQGEAFKHTPKTYSQYA
jgi:hypothetical protein